MADLSAFATKELADEGVIIPVRIDGMKFPMAVKVYGDDSDVVKDFEKQRIRNLGLGKKGKTEVDEEDIDELLEHQDEAVVIRIGGIWTYDWKKKAVVQNEPLELFGKTLGCNKESYEYLVEKMPAIKDWVLEKAKDRTYFLSNGKKN